MRGRKRYTNDGCSSKKRLSGRENKKRGGKNRRMRMGRVEAVERRKTSAL